MSPAAGPRDRAGFSLVEVMIAMSLLALAMMSLAGAAALGLSQMGRAHQDMQYSSDVQQVADSLIGAGWNRVSSGAGSIRGRSVNWTVSTVNPNSQKIDIVVERRGQHNTSVIYLDTVTVYVSKARLE